MRFFTVGIHGKLDLGGKDYYDGVHSYPGVVFPTTMEWNYRKDGPPKDHKGTKFVSDESAWGPVVNAIFGLACEGSDGNGQISNELLASPGGGAILLPSWQQMLQELPPGGRSGEDPSMMRAPVAVVVTRASVSLWDYGNQYGYELVPEVAATGPPSAFIKVLHDPALWGQMEDDDLSGEVEESQTTGLKLSLDCAIVTVEQSLVYRLRIPDYRLRTKYKYLDVRITFDGEKVYWAVGGGEKQSEKGPTKIIP